MSYVLLGVGGLAALGAGMAWALHAATRVAARLFGVPDFRWFAATTASGSLARRTGVRAFGVLGPYAVCVVLFFVGRLTTGNPVPTTSVTVLDGPAQEAGMQTGDRVVSIDGKPIESWDALRATVRERGGSRRIEIERAGARRVVEVTPTSNGTIGVMTIDKKESASVADALGEAVAAPVRTFSQMARAVAGSGERAELMGPVGIVKSTGKQSEDGAFLRFLALLATTYFPAIASVHVFDAVTLAFFRRARPSATDSDDRSRLARRRQSLIIALVCLVGSGLGKVVVGADGGFVAALLLLVTVPGALAHYPLVWLLARDLDGVATARWKLALCVLLPCAGLIVGALLIRQVSRRLGPAAVTP